MPLLAAIVALLMPIEDNAALKYWTGFALLPPISEERQARLRDASKPLAIEQIDELLESAGPSLDYLHRGAALDRCRWALSNEDGPFLEMPFVEKSRQLADLACLRARRRFDRGQDRDGVDDVIAVLRLARHVNAEATPLTILVQYNLEQLAIDTIGRQLGKLDARQRGRLEAALKQLPEAASLGDCLMGKREHVIDWMSKQIRSFPESRWKAQYAQLFPSEEDGKKAMAQAANAEAALHQLAQARELFEPYSKLIALPYEQVRERWPIFYQEALARTPAAALLPPADVFFLSRLKAQVKIALLRAALAVERDGESTIAKQIDPATGKPFAYEKTEFGFRLSSGLQSKGAPMRLEVSKK